MRSTDIPIYKRRKTIASVLRVIILITGVLQIVFGEFAVGAAILLCLAAITLPGLLTRGKVKSMPLDIEIILFVMVMLQFVIGETLNFYDNVPYYDKLVHFTLPFFLGYLGFLFAYTMQATGNLRMTKPLMVIVVVLISLGIGAVWEIVEYLSDIVLHTYLQGSMTASPLVDTMNDLIVDTLGGIFGALLGLKYMNNESNDPNSRLSVLSGELAEDYSIISKS